MFSVCAFHVSVHVVFVILFSNCTFSLYCYVVYSCCFFPLACVDCVSFLCICSLVLLVCTISFVLIIVCLSVAGSI